MDDTLRMAQDSGLVLASHRRLERAFSSDEWKDFADALPCWSGTAAAYEKPGKKLGCTIEFTDGDTGSRYVFRVPPEHVGKRDVILMAEHPSFIMVQDGRDLVIMTKSAIAAVLPENSGWYAIDPATQLPGRKKTTERDPEARMLVRDEKMVTLVARSAVELDPRKGLEGTRDVLLCYPPSSTLGSIIETRSRVLRFPKELH